MSCIPVRCFTCGKIVGNLWRKYEIYKLSYSVEDALSKVGLERACCRKMLLTHVDQTDNLLLYDPTPNNFDQNQQQYYRDGENYYKFINVKSLYEYYEKCSLSNILINDNIYYIPISKRTGMEIADKKVNNKIDIPLYFNNEQYYIGSNLAESVKYLYDFNKKNLGNTIQFDGVNYFIKIENDEKDIADSLIKNMNKCNIDRVVATINL